jgi:hypothetical protein
MPKRPPVLGQPETIELLLERSNRPNDAVPLRTLFVQKGAQARPQPGPAAAFLSFRKNRELELLLLIHAVCSGDDFSVTEWSTTWARCIGLFDSSSGPTAVSRAWRWLDEQQLIVRERGTRGRTKITILREDGTGQPYKHPFTKSRIEPYFQLPYEYWRAEDRWHSSLSLPAKVVLLITLSMTKPTFQLPQERMPEWYGISADSALRGLSELRERRVLEVAEVKRVPSLESKTGLAERNLYRLLPPFHLERRGMGRKKKSAGRRRRRK